MPDHYRTKTWILLASVTVALGCGDDSPMDPDAGTAMCVTDVDCGDGIFCNGVERCMPGSADIDERGCVPGDEPCAEGACDEAAGRCLGECANPDRDGDGVDGIACGGDDCDDRDPNRFPGNPELCDRLGRDEDCDPTTLGPDEDGDGATDAACCNLQGDGSLACGTDCDDTRSSVNPGGTEVCNGFDEDCDGDIDEGVRTILYRDLDGDGFGASATAMERACGDPLYVPDGNDCDDTDATIAPGAEEICDGRDNDCDGDPSDEIDADGDRHLASGSTCSGGPLPVDDCRDDDSTINGGALDRCNNVDDDCDGTVDERATTDVACSAGADRARAVCTYTGTPALGNGCLITACEPGFGNCDGDVGNGCEVDLRSDAEHCGGCGFTCSAGPCVEGICEAEAFTPVQLALSDGSVGTICLRSTDDRLACRGSTFGSGTQGRLLPIIETDGSLVDDAVDVDVHQANSICFLRDTGQVACFGNAAPGRSDPFDVGVRDVAGITGATSLSMGERFVCATTPTALRCFGREQYGRLGNGGAASGGMPVDAITPEGGTLVATMVDAREATACAIEAGTRRVLCWGNDGFVMGPTGFGARLATPSPILDGSGAPLLADEVRVGGSHACARDGSSVFCWGSNQFGEVDPRDPSVVTVDRARLLRETDDSVVVADQLALGDRLTCVRGGTPTSWRCSGENDAGQAGQSPPDPALGFFTEPAVDHLEYRGLPMATMAVDGELACGLFADWLHCWGTNQFQSLLAPVAVTGTHEAIAGRLPGSATTVAVGYEHACARTSAGRVLCWGRNGDPQPLGLDPLVRETATPVPIPLTNVLDVAATADSTCALLDDGAVSCWGEGSTGQLGDGTVAPTGTPSLVSGLTDAVAIGAGVQQVCAVRATGDVVCWGRNEEGALGDGASHADCGGVDCSATPVTVVGLPSGTRPVELGGGGLAIPGFAVLAPGFMCARMDDGTVWCWGSSLTGTLGNGTLLSSPTPVQVSGIDDAVTLAVGGLHACVLRAGGTVECWGAAAALASDRSFPSCGAGITCSTEPVAARTVGLNRQLMATGNGACTEGTDGAVRCWGDVTDDDGDGIGELYPGDPIPGVTNIRFLAGGNELACAGRADRDLLCWGPNFRGDFISGGSPPLEPTVVVGL